MSNLKNKAVPAKECKAPTGLLIYKISAFLTSALTYETPVYIHIRNGAVGAEIAVEKKYHLRKRNIKTVYLIRDGNAFFERSGNRFFISGATNVGKEYPEGFTAYISETQEKKMVAIYYQFTKKNYEEARRQFGMFMNVREER